MHRTRFEKLKDDLIGEAVLLILKDNGPINFKSLAIKLKKMASTERDTERRSALSAAVAEVDQKVKSSESMHSDVIKKNFISNMQYLAVNPKQH
ncbi:hypothetical protein [Leclercia adecarboxylata]|uniref:hypothetical protein n=1 Tax=Leclercia adecarboxylata TaxID=83655 RepID=UPI000E9A0925|nr:hypothetical protein [Leclercia adecarboxylata]HBX12323.1 hypothetical protein [Leclercia adecarboxylata]